jgi:hypothetical protein
MLCSLRFAVNPRDLAAAYDLDLALVKKAFVPGVGPGDDESLAARAFADAAEHERESRGSPIIMPLRCDLRG